jgi:hypothetical protein
MIESPSCGTNAWRTCGGILAQLAYCGENRRSHKAHASVG